MTTLQQQMPVEEALPHRKSHHPLPSSVHGHDDELPVDGVTSARSRVITVEERERFESHIADILGALGMNLDTPGTADTPKRFIQALIDATAGYEGDPKLVTVFPTECHGDASCELAQIVEGPIPFFALCEHHALPFFGTAYVGYVAHDQIIGISKLTRLVRVVTQRFGVQERMTHDIARALEELLGAHGVAVYMEADHMCTQMRGVREDAATTRTTGYRGVYEHDPNLRAEFFTLSGIGPGSANGHRR